MQEAVRTLLLAAVGMTIASCAALPTADKVASFGDAASSSSNAMKEALNANRLVALQTSREREAVAYITHKPYLLRMDDVDKSNLVQAREQVAVLSALNLYAKALVKAADQGTIADLEAASARLGASAGTLAAAAVPTAAPIVGPAFKLTGRLLGIALGNAYAAEIQSIISATDPTVQKIALTMPTSLNAVGLLVEAQVEGYEVQRQILMDAIRRDSKVDRLRLYKEYLVARSDVETLQMQASILKSSAVVFQELAEAHKALANGAPDSSALVKKFAATAAELSELISAVRATQGG
ncbi:hypothetical protein [Mesorhizobium sp. BR1-1-14]|uniref:hypothetical protein n=1 Tax=Mesorhizobium sp. BR1-1-14 TaxID=2876655 RepID=UPI001CD10873|nr:hypothetical protein [Mesorhizobium sp. BR1-1-14]MBZ9959322.1 hypothetical protein [Mesorhizobium sp. BR1-1-14]